MRPLLIPRVERARRVFFRTFQLLIVWWLAELASAQTALKPGDNLIVEGIPPIPVEIPQRADRYTEFRSAAVFDWHPQRRNC